MTEVDVSASVSRIERLNNWAEIILCNLDKVKDDGYVAEVLKCFECPFLPALDFQTVFAEAQLFHDTHNRYPTKEYLEKAARFEVVVPGEFSYDIVDDYLRVLKSYVNQLYAYDALHKDDPATAIRLLSEAIHADGQVLPNPLTGDAWKETPEDRRWLVEGWLPEGEITLLSGPGGGGKSILTLQLSTALAASEPCPQWLPGGASPSLCSRVTVVVAGWEDDRSEFIRRKNRMSQYGRCDWLRDPAVNGRLHVLPMRGHGPVWHQTDPRNQDSGELTSLGRALRAYCETVDARLLVIDPVSLAFDIEENARAQVSRVLDSWAGWASECNCAVLFTGHPAKAKTGESSDYSGSTAWRGMVRSLWTLKPEEEKTKKDTPGKTKKDTPEEKTKKDTPKENEESEDETPAWTKSVLTLDKANYGPSGTKIRLEAISDNKSPQDYLAAWGGGGGMKVTTLNPGVKSLNTPSDTPVTEDDLFE